MKNLFIFLDESGNLDFSKKGTSHFVLAAVTALQPIKSSAKLQDLKYELLTEGEDIQHFHASEDKQIIRDKVFQVINGLRTSTSITFTLKNARRIPPFKVLRIFMACWGERFSLIC